MVIAKIGRYPLHHGTVAAVRSLGRLGIRVYAVTEGPLAPTALSRYLAERITWPTTGDEEPEELVAGLLRIGERVGRRSVLLVTDDRAAVLVAEHRTALEAAFHLPAVDRTLPGRLAGKQGLYDLCKAHGVPTPRSEFPQTATQLRDAVRALGLPVVVKNTQVWSRRDHAALKSTTILRTAADVEALAARLAERSCGGLLVQEYLPHDPRENSGPPDWFTHFYCDGQGQAQVMFTGVKIRSWPPGAGVTARGVSVFHPRLAATAADLLPRGRLPRNRRPGLAVRSARRAVQARGLQSAAGRPIPALPHHVWSRCRARASSGLVTKADSGGPSGRRPRARRRTSRRRRGASGAAGRAASSTRAAAQASRRSGVLPASRRREPAWFAWDDPLPFAAATARFVADTVRVGWQHLKP